MEEGRRCHGREQPDLHGGACPARLRIRVPGDCHQRQHWLQRGERYVLCICERHGDIGSDDRPRHDLRRRRSDLHGERGRQLQRQRHLPVVRGHGRDGRECGWRCHGPHVHGDARRHWHEEVLRTGVDEPVRLQGRRLRLCGGCKRPADRNGEHRTERGHFVRGPRGDADGYSQHGQRQRPHVHMVPQRRGSDGRDGQHVQRSADS